MMTLGGLFQEKWRYWRWNNKSAKEVWRMTLDDVLLGDAEGVRDRLEFDHIHHFCMTGHEVSADTVRLALKLNEVIHA